MKRYIGAFLLILYAAMPIMASAADIPQPGDPEFIGPLSEEQIEDLNG